MKEQGKRFAVKVFKFGNTVVLYVQVELDPEKQLKIKSGFFSHISANQIIRGDRKSVNNRHVWFSSSTNSGKGCNGYCTFMACP